MTVYCGNFLSEEDIEPGGPEGPAAAPGERGPTKGEQLAVSQGTEQPGPLGVPGTDSVDRRA